MINPCRVLAICYGLTDLPTVLIDSSNDYLYGLGNLAQISPENTDYFLGDALGSTRQLSNSGQPRSAGCLQIEARIERVKV
jgi:hypothetical protein